MLDFIKRNYDADGVADEETFIESYSEAELFYLSNIGMIYFPILGKIRVI